MGFMETNIVVYYSVVVFMTYMCFYFLDFVYEW